MEKVSSAKLLNKTKAFLGVRIIAQLIITAIMLALCLGGLFIVVRLMNTEGATNSEGKFNSGYLFLTKDGWGILVLFVLACVIIGVLRFAKRYVLYMIKAAHIAAMTEYIKTGRTPQTEGYGGVLAYGTQVVKKNFISVNVAVAADAAIEGATRQIMRWANRIGSLFSFIPGGKTIMQFIEMILSTALNYIDEAVLSYVFYNQDQEGNGFKKACDGLVYYAQSWKSMLKGALKASLFIWILRLATLGLVYFIVSTFGTAILELGGVGVLGLIITSLVILYGLEAVLVEPYVTCIMVNDYHKAIANQPLKKDLYGTLCKVSGKFRGLYGKSEQGAAPKEVYTQTSIW